ncbi:hypothetical protein ACFSHT_01020 [Paraburkholderia silviterrae]|nr:hypothetical protein [Paraburkholderia silviterrae]
MSFALLLYKLPHVEEARAQYEGLLALHEHVPGLPARLWQRVKQLFS